MVGILQVKMEHYGYAFVHFRGDSNGIENASCCVEHLNGTFAMGIHLVKCELSNNHHECKKLLL